MKIALVGSRNYPHLDLVRRYIRKLDKWDVVISGGAIGVDEVAEAEAKRNKLKTNIIYPEWATYGKAAGAIRNKLIVEAADKVVAFWDGQSKGTKITIDLAMQMGKPIEIIKNET